MAEAKTDDRNTRFSGMWKLHKNENMDNFLKTMNVPWPVRKIIIAQKPTLRMELTDATFRFVEQRKELVDHTYNFGERHEEAAPDGMKKHVVVEWVGDTLVRKDYKQEDGSLLATTIYSVEGEQLTCTLEYGSVQAHRYYNRQVGK